MPVRTHLAIEDLLAGHAPTEAWLATEQAARMLSDADRRTSLYRAMHPEADLSYAPLLRALLAHEVAYRRGMGDDPEDRFENLYWCALLLSQIGDLRDVLALWRAKQTNFDTGCAFDIQFLVIGAGVQQTLAFLAQLDDPDAAAATEYISTCATAGDFEDLEGWLAFRRGYFE